MNGCKFNDCGWCYAKGLPTNDHQGACVNPTACPTYNQDINKHVLIPHNWELDGKPGLYDNNYICTQCNCSFTESMDSPENKPSVGCNVQLPEEKSLWTHHNGKEYRVVSIANQFSEDLVKYPIVVVYKGFNGRIWAKTLANFLIAMTATEKSNVED